MAQKKSKRRAPKKISKNSIQTFIPCLWFDDQAEEAANFYVSVFSKWSGSSGKKSSGIITVTKYGAAGSKVSGQPEGSVMTVTFRLNGQEFMALNGGPIFKFSEAISFMVNCNTQREIDELWKNLTKGGEEVQCGWLKDKYGLSWQIVPTIQNEMMKDKDPKKQERVTEAVLKMKKFDIQALKQAYKGA